MNLTKEHYDELIIELEAKGYREGRKYRNEDYAFWKSFHITYEDINNSDTKQIGYKIGVLILYLPACADRQGRDYHIQFEFHIGENPHVDKFKSTVRDSAITITKFEELAEEIYQKICKGFIFEKFEKKEDF